MGQIKEKLIALSPVWLGLVDEENYSWREVIQVLTERWWREYALLKFYEEGCELKCPTRVYNGIAHIKRWTGTK